MVTMPMQSTKRTKPALCEASQSSNDSGGQVVEWFNCLRRLGNEQSHGLAMNHCNESVEQVTALPRCMICKLIGRNRYRTA